MLKAEVVLRQRTFEELLSLLVGNQILNGDHGIADSRSDVSANRQRGQVIVPGGLWKVNGGLALKTKLETILTQSTRGAGWRCFFDFGQQAFKEVSAAVLKTVKIALPDTDVVGQFAASVASIFRRQDLLELENQQLTQLRDWLLPMLMNGQVTLAKRQP